MRHKDERVKLKVIRISQALALAGILLSAFSCAPASVEEPGKYALIIGIGDYINYDDEDDLIFPPLDADSLADLLTLQGWTVEPPLKDTAATKEGIRSRIESFFQGIPSDATALIYYSGHGTESNGVAYLVPADFMSVDFSPLISAEEMGAWISDYIPTENVIFIADSCYSGGFVGYSDSSDSIGSPYDGWGGNASVSALAALDDFGTLLGKNAAASGALAPIVISAAGDLEESWEASWLAHGVFTYYLLESAAEGDANGDGYVTCTEAYTYAAKAIEREWNSTQPGSFYPHITDGLRDLVLFTANP